MSLSKGRVLGPRRPRPDPRALRRCLGPGPEHRFAARPGEHVCPRCRKVLDAPGFRVALREEQMLYVQGPGPKGGVVHRSKRAGEVAS